VLLSMSRSNSRGPDIQRQNKSAQMLRTKSDYVGKGKNASEVEVGSASDLLGLRPNSSEVRSSGGSTRSNTISSTTLSLFEIEGPFGETDTSENIIEEVEGQAPVIKAATVEKLVYRVTFEGRPDPKLVEDFLLTYRSFTSPEDLMELLCLRYNPKCVQKQSSKESKDFQEKLVRPVRLRVFNLCKTWVHKYNADFKDDPVLVKQFSKWMEKNFAKDFGGNVKKLVKELHQVSKEGDGVSSGSSDGNTRNTKNPKPHIPQSISGAGTLLDFHPVEVARQLSLIEMEQYRMIKPWELLHQLWTKEDGGAVHVREMISWSTRVSQLVSTEIIKVPIKKKSQMISHCIQIAQECCKLNNFNGVMEILAGFSNSAVNRLQPFFKEVPKKEQKQLKELRATLSSDSNFKRLRAIIKESEPPLLPYLGMFLTDLTFIEDGNADRVKNNLINFTKCRLQSQVIRDIQQYMQIPFRFDDVPVIQKFLRTAMTMDNKILYKVSIKHLPRSAKESSVKELEKGMKDRRKEGGDGEGSMKSSDTFDDVMRKLEEDEDLTIVNLSGQGLDFEKLLQLGKSLKIHENVHTLRLSHGGIVMRTSEDDWGWMRHLSHIRTLDLSHQDLEHVPSEISYMKKLENLRLSHNKIAHLPPELGKCKNLQQLWLEVNLLEECVEELRYLQSLRSVNLSCNKLLMIPVFFCELPNLKYFYVSDNPVQKSTIPPELLQKGGKELLDYLAEKRKESDRLGSLIGGLH